MFHSVHSFFNDFSKKLDGTLFMLKSAHKPIIPKIEIKSSNFFELKANSDVTGDRYKTTSDQWLYLHKSIIFLVSILILKDVLFRPMQNNLSLVINCLSCCVNWCSWGVSCSLHHIRTRPHRSRICPDKLLHCCCCYLENISSPSQTSIKLNCFEILL